MFVASDRHNGRNLLVGEGLRCLGHDFRLTDISVRCSKIAFWFLHCPGELVRRSWPEIEDAAFQVTVPAIEEGIGFGLQNLGHISPCHLSPIDFQLGYMSLTLPI